MKLIEGLNECGKIYLGYTKLCPECRCPDRITKRVGEDGYTVECASCGKLLGED